MAVVLLRARAALAFGVTSVTMSHRSARAPSAASLSSSDVVVSEVFLAPLLTGLLGASCATSCLSDGK